MKKVYFLYLEVMDLEVIQTLLIKMGNISLLEGKALNVEMFIIT